MKRYAGPATRLLSGAPALRRFEFPRMSLLGSPVNNASHRSATVGPVREKGRPRISIGKLAGVSPESL